MPTDINHNVVYQGSMLISFKNTLERVLPEHVDLTKTIVSSNTAKAILFKYEIEHNRINIIINREQRPATVISGSQGDHVTAYTVLLQTICGLIDGEEVHEAPRILYETTNCFLEHSEDLQFKSYKTKQLISFEDKLREVQAKFFPKTMRKKLINSLKAIQSSVVAVNDTDDLELEKALKFIKSDNVRGKKKLNIDKLRSCIKRSNQELFAQVVVDLGEQILKQYNRQSTATFPKLEEDYGKNTGEGTRVKMAMLHLRLLNKLLKLKKNINKTELVDFKIVCSDIIKAAMPQIKDEQIINNKFNNFLNILFNFDKKFKTKKTIIDLSNIEEYLDQININYLKTKEIGRLFNDLFDFKQSKISQVMPNPLPCLYEVTARHTNFMFKAFNNLTMLPVKLKEEIIDGFYEEIIEKSNDANDNYQGWGEWLIYNQTTGKITCFSKQDLAKGVGEYNNSHPSVREYRELRKQKLNI